MNRTERKRLARLEKRCDWLKARITRGTAKKRNMSFEIAGLQQGIDGRHPSWFSILRRGRMSAVGDGAR